MAALSPSVAHGHEQALGLRGSLGVDHVVMAPLDSNSPPGAAFVLSGLLIEGASVYPAEAFSSFYADRLTQETTIADLAEIAEAITARYRSDGYFLSRAIVPAQTFADGFARIRVYEGYIADVRIVGDSNRRAQQVLESLTETRPLRLRDLDQRLAVLREVAGGSLEPPQLEPNLDDPSAHTLIVNFHIAPLAGELTIDNRGSQSYGGWRLYARAARNSAFVPGDQLSLAVLTAPGAPDDLLNGEVTYTTPVNGAATYATFEASQGSFTDDEDEVRKFHAFAMRLSHPFVISRRESLWGHLELAALDVEKDRSGAPIIDEQVLTLSGALFARRETEMATTTLFSRALIGHAASPTDSLRSRFSAAADFATLRFLARHTRDLQNRLSLQLALTGQLASGPLVSSEEIYFGGGTFARGYRFGAAHGDHGLGAALELRYAPPWEAPLLESYRVYLFYDAATVWNEVSGRTVDESLISAGGGVRLTPVEGLFLQLETGRAFTDAPHNESPDPWRRTVRLQLSF